MLQREHPNFNSLCKYAEMKVRSQIFFADLSRFHLIMTDFSFQRLSSPNYGRAYTCNCITKRAGSSRWFQPPPEPAYKPAIRGECLQPVDRRQIEAGIGEGHQFSMDEIPVAFLAGHGILMQYRGVLCSGILRVAGRSCPSGGGFDADGPGVEPVKIPESLF